MQKVSSTKNNINQLDKEIIFLNKEIKRLNQENKLQKIRIERKGLELQKYWLKELGL